MEGMGSGGGLYLFFGTSASYRSNFLEDHGVQIDVALPDLVSRIPCCWPTQRDMNGRQGIIFKTMGF